MRVQDEAEPTVVVPAALEVEATAPEGATVDYGTIGAVDNVDGDLPTICKPPANTVFVLGVTTVQCSAEDGAGNVGSQTFDVTVRDSTAPALSVPANIAVTATSAQGAHVDFAPASASDVVDTAVQATCSSASGTVFPPGTTTVTCSAADASGNSASKSFTVSVTYSWTGVRPPVNADGTSVFKLGSTVPVKFQLTGASAAVEDATAKLFYSKVSNGVAGTEAEAIATNAPDAGNVFRYDGAQYIFNLATRPLSEGSWLLRIDLGDGVQRVVNIGLRR